MPAQTTKSQFTLAGAMRTHAADPVQPRQDFSDLPGGITGGTAELVEAKVGSYQKSAANDKSGRTGQPFIYMAGVVADPISHTFRRPAWSSEGGRGAKVYGPTETVKVQGLRTSQTLPLCQTTTSIGQDAKVKSGAENVANALNELKQLGGQDCCNSLSVLPAGATLEQSLKALEMILSVLKSVRPRIRFRFSSRFGNPSAQYPEPMVFETWHGTEGAARPADNGQTSVVPPGIRDATAQEPAAAEELPADVAGDDVASLVAAANADDEVAQAKLHEMCAAAGVDEDWYTGDDTTWEHIAAALTEGGDEAAAEEVPAEPEPWAPVAKEVYGYKPRGKSGAPLKARDCSVVKVDSKKQTVELLDADKKTKHVGVAWDALIRA